MFEYIGALHMHSIFSDGTGNADDIARIADEVGLDFIILTDHNTLRALTENFEGWYGNTLLLVGCEINDRKNENHLLAFNVKEAYSTRLSAIEYVNKVREAGGLGFLAHPHEKRQHMKEHPPYPWTEWRTEEYHGIEIWNHMSEWMENLTEQNKYQAFLHPLKSIKSPPEETLKLWDEISLKRSVVGIGGIDAHAHKYSLLGFLEVEIFPYKVLFKSIRTHIITEKELKKGRGEKGLNSAKEIVYKALAAGHCFVANDYHGDSKGFMFGGSSGEESFIMGDTVSFKKGMRCFVKSPKKGEIRVIHNGEEIERKEGDKLEFIPKKEGVYRVEVYLSGKAWIYSNPIRVGI
jgi:hypothetical protein